MCEVLKEEYFPLSATHNEGEHPEGAVMLDIFGKRACVLYPSENAARLGAEEWNAHLRNSWVGVHLTNAAVMEALVAAMVERLVEAGVDVATVTRAVEKSAKKLMV